MKLHISIGHDTLLASLTLLVDADDSCETGSETASQIKDYLYIEELDPSIEEEKQPMSLVCNVDAPFPSLPVEGESISKENCKKRTILFNT